MNSHAAQGNVAEMPHGKVVAAYGDRMCPKLVEQVAADDIVVRVNALGVLCNEFNNPYMLQGCTSAGVTPVLGQMISDPDFTTRERASRALSIAANDAIGINVILSEGVVPDILKGASDPTIDVRTNIYKCLFNLTRVPEGIDTVVEAGGTQLLVKAVGNEEPSCQSYMLLTIQNLVKTQRGLSEASFYKAVRVCISLLGSEHENVVIQAARALGFICFSDKEKDEAIAENGVPVLCSLISPVNVSTAVCIAVTGALMSITSADESKRQMGAEGCIDVVMRTLIEAKDRIIIVNTLKLTSNCAVLPASRLRMVENEEFLAKLVHLSESTDRVICKHADVALKAVRFSP